MKFLKQFLRNSTNIGWLFKSSFGILETLPYLICLYFLHAQKVFEEFAILGVMFYGSGKMNKNVLIQTAVTCITSFTKLHQDHATYFRPYS